MAEVVQDFAVRSFMPERPKLGCEFARRWFEKRRQIDVVRAEAYAVFAQSRAGGLVEGFDLIRHRGPIEDSQCLDQLKGHPAGNASDVACCCKLSERT